MKLKTKRFTGGDTTFKPSLEVVEGKNVINKRNLLINFVGGLACIATPGTNWLIFIIANKFKIIEVKF